MKKLFFSDYRNVYSELEVFLIIQELIKKECDYEIHLKRLMIAEMIKHISTSDLLHKTFNLIIDLELFNEYTSFDEQLNSNIDFDSYSNEDRIKIKAISFSEAILFTLHLSKLGLKADPNLTLQLTYGKDYIESNNDEVGKYVKRKVYSDLVKHFDDKPDLIKQKFYQDALSSIAQIDYENETNFFSEEKQLFRDLIHPIDNTVAEIKFQEPPSVPNPYPKIFMGTDNKGYQLFKEFIDLTQIKQHKDWSFLFQFLLKDEIILPLKHSTFFNWIYSEGFVSEDYYNDFHLRRNFTSLQKVKGNALRNTYVQLNMKHFGNR
ncbi:hypothetical protein [uncultured Christiangramia sp.]|uniref:hypothetical protein n=1 Tax=uncultured Christiangramia sp. TaxID=503836 RepID=UPI0026077BEB|nr:hypothetical protein [uncultured Christiangramia sp.]